MRALVPLIPDLLVKFFARPYVAGDTLESGLAVARKLMEERGIHSSLDLLAEETRTAAEAEEFLSIHHAMVDALATFPDPKTRPTLSLKPSTFTTHPLNGGPGPRAPESVRAVREIALHAKEKGIPVTIDMEDRHWTDWTLELTRELFEAGIDVGTVVQTRLNRTEKDLESLPPGMRVRIVIGIYIEPPEVASRNKREMKERMLRAAEYLLRRGQYVEFATHDETYVRRFLEEVVPATGVGRDRYEVQMIYGVPRRGFQDDLVAGRIGRQGPVKVRVYVPFACSWDHAIAYCRRRLIENPSMMTAVARNLGRILSRRN